MMRNLRPEEEKIIKDIRNLFKLKQELNYTAIKDESNGDRNKTLLVEEYLNKITPCLKDSINNIKKTDTWKVQLTIASNFISSMDNDKERVMNLKSDNIEMMMNDKTDEIIEEPFDSLKNRYQNSFQSIKGSQFVFDHVHLLYDICHNKNLNRGGWYIDSPDWIKSKKATINPIKKRDDKFLQYAVTVEWRYEEIKKDLQRITKIKPFVNKYNLEGINLPSEKYDWKKFEKSNVTISLNVLYSKK